MQGPGTGRGRDAIMPAWMTQGQGGLPGPPGGGMGAPGGPPQGGPTMNQGPPPGWRPPGPGPPPQQQPGRPPFQQTGYGPPGGPMHMQPPPGQRPPQFQAQSYPGPPQMAQMPGMSGPPPVVQQQQGPPFGGVPPRPMAPPQGFVAPAASPGPRPVQATSPAVPAAAASAAGALPQGWTEHTAPDGRKYYYNSALKKSSWTRPEAASAATPVAAPAVKAASPAAATATMQEKMPEAVVTDWKEFTAPDGRKYYHNRVTKESKWTLPEELKHAREAAAGPKSAIPAQPTGVQVVKLEDIKANGSSASSSLKPDLQEVKPAATTQKPVSEVFQYATKEEAKDAFKEMLAEVGVQSDWSWDKALRSIVTDPRYGALKSIGEKKACFNEYTVQRAKDEREENRARVKKARDEFFTLLELSPEIQTGMRYSKALAVFEDEPRWKAIPDSREREELYNEHMKERERKERELKKIETKKLMAEFRALLEHTPSIKHDTQWRKAQTKLEGEEEFEALDKYSRLDVFEEYVRELQEKEKKRLLLEKEEKRRAERKNRDAFKALLAEHKEEGKILPKMRWSEYYPLAKHEDALLAVEKNTSGSRPKELFQDVLEEVEEVFEKQQKLITEALRKGDVVVEAFTSFEDFEAGLDSDSEELAEISKATRQLVYEELVGRAKEKAAKEEKRRKRAKEDFQLLLRDTRDIEHTSTWEEWQPKLEREPEAKLLSVEDQEALFDEFLDKLRVRQEKDDKKSSKHKDKKHKKGKDADKEKRRHSSSKRKLDDSDEEEKNGKRHKKDKKERHRDASESPELSPAAEKDAEMPERNSEDAGPEDGEVA